MAKKKNKTHTQTEMAQSAVTGTRTHRATSDRCKAALSKETHTFIIRNIFLKGKKSCADHVEKINNKSGHSFTR